MPDVSWNVKYEKCVSCGTKSREGRNRYCAIGKCERCWYIEFRSAKEGYRERERARGKERRAAIQADPVRKEKLRMRMKLYYAISPVYKEQCRRRNIRDRFDHFIRKYFNHERIFKQQVGLTVRFELSDREVKMLTPLKPTFTNEEMQLFRERLERYFKKQEP